MEIIKGLILILYGGGVIVGLINFILKIFEEKRDLGLYFNGIFGKGLDVSVFYG